MQNSDYVERYVFQEQDLRHQRRRTDVSRKKNAPKRRVDFDYKDPYQPHHFHEQMKLIKSLDEKWEYAATTRLDEGRNDVLSSFALAVGILSKHTRDRMKLVDKAKQANPDLELDWADDVKTALKNINSVLERLLQASESLGWKSEIKLRQSVWVSIFMCLTLGNLENQKNDAWTPFEPNIRSMCFKPDLPISKYTVHELWMTIMSVKKEWSHIRINDETIEFLDRLRIRAAITCSLTFSTNVNVHDVESFRSLFRDGDISMYRPNEQYLNFLMFFFSDVDRALSFRHNFTYRCLTRAPEQEYVLGKRRSEKFISWLQGGIDGEHHMPILGQFKSTFILTMLRPGDVETYRENSKANVVKGAKMQTYANPKPLQVFSELNKTEVDVIQEKWYTNLRSLPSTRLDVPMHREARDHLDKLVFRSTMSTHADVDFLDYYHEYNMADVDPDEGDSTPKEWQVMRMMGDFYVYRWSPEPTLYLVHSMAEALFVWLKKFIQQRSEEIDKKKGNERKKAKHIVDLLKNMQRQMFEQGIYVTLPTETKRDVYKEFMGSSKDIVPMTEDADKMQVEQEDEEESGGEEEGEGESSEEEEGGKTILVDKHQEDEWLDFLHLQQSKGEKRNKKQTGKKGKNKRK